MVQSNLTYEMPQHCCSAHHDYNNNNKYKQGRWDKQKIKKTMSQMVNSSQHFLSYLVSIYSKTFSNWAVIKSKVLLSATKIQLSVSCLITRFLSKLNPAVLVRTVITSHISD